MIHPEWAKREEERLLISYWDDPKYDDVDIMDYLKSVGSKRLVAYYNARDAEVRKAKKEGVIIN